MAADGDCHHLCKLMEPVRHRWSISDVIVEIRNTVMPSDCSALRFGIRSNCVHYGFHETFLKTTKLREWLVRSNMPLAAKIFFSALSL
ncbi:hypothetical protein ANN_04412 [Periplaneta americana]|uniref:Uncharacterized protein n=1 Tax=Periplaneta americana TaxID=6978 RepID=A0ABQ8TA22_PERAM|nr:hypothetical protein ANN_04412 [Periplaneta americana]